MKLVECSLTHVYNSALNENNHTAVYVIEKGLAIVNLTNTFLELIDSETYIIRTI